jgi:hypothetical protein
MKSFKTTVRDVAAKLPVMDKLDQVVYMMKFVKDALGWECFSPELPNIGNAFLDLYLVQLRLSFPDSS